MKRQNKEELKECGKRRERREMERDEEEGEISFVDCVSFAAWTALGI